MTSDLKDKPPSRLQIWKLASRPHTLTASISPVLAGYALTLHYCLCLDGVRGGECRVDKTAIGWMAVQFAMFAGLIQIGTNLHNDYADFVKGADTDQRIGQARATQKGWLTPYETCRGCVICLTLAFFIGSWCLIPSSESCYNTNSTFWERHDPIMIFVVMSSLFNAVAYTGGPFPLGYIHPSLGNISIGYSGLGDLFVFLYFGIVATMGVPYLYLTKVECLDAIDAFYDHHGGDSTAIQLLQVQSLRQTFVPSIPIGFLATAIIVVNNLRDRHTDINAGKKTVAVRFGETFARAEYFFLVVFSYGFCLYLALLENEFLALLPLLSIPAAMTQLKAVAFGGKDGQDLNDHVGGTAKVQMVYCILLSIGLTLSRKSII
ncbi:hypothetical protein ACHAW6_012258 [Cyclotella cf. meneghiniana]